LSTSARAHMSPPAQFISSTATEGKTYEHLPPITGGLETSCFSGLSYSDLGSQESEQSLPFLSLYSMNNEQF